MNKYFVFTIISALAIGSILAAGAGGVLNSTVIAQDNMTMTMDNSTMPMGDMGNMTMEIDDSANMTNSTQ
ncbi:hypothetical protein [Candidatus Nitrosocosmicus hydrocola]|jgi:hypothetical protein|uniref:hypothetical protein n=1 Tax=Candidatus Nitrosocosmicus hydrocola TaxID=1826872 RepID=UPI0011E5B8D3|nr:hypothetical protein [Candidatus Nitrosocosmicus hydrocola]